MIETQGRRGTFVRSAASTPTPSAVQDRASDFVAAARSHGLTCAEAVRLVETAWAV